MYCCQFFLRVKSNIMSPTCIAIAGHEISTPLIIAYNFTSLHTYIYRHPHHHQWDKYTYIPWICPIDGGTSLHYSIPAMSRHRRWLLYNNVNLFNTTDVSELLLSSMEIENYILSDQRGERREGTERQPIRDTPVTILVALIIYNCIPKGIDCTKKPTTKWREGGR